MHLCPAHPRHGAHALGAALLAALLAAPGEDLAALYPATLEAAADEPLTWECTADDVWALRSFVFDVPKQLKIKLGRSTAILGHHDRNALWALVVPERSAEISSSVRGDGEEIAHVWLRFHPARLGDLFPERTVTGPGDGGLRVHGTRVARYKLPGLWSEGDRPLLPGPEELLLDVETVDGKRRPFRIDLGRETVEYESSLQARMLPAPVPIDRKEAVRTVERLVELVETSHGEGPVAVELDWSAARKELSRSASKAATTLDVGVLAWGFLSHLDDPDLYVRVGEEVLPGFGMRREYNADAKAIGHILGDVRWSDDIPWSRTPHKVGYIRLSRGYEDDAVENFDAALEILADTWALILDLRFNGSISPENAAAIAGRFLAEPAVYGHVEEFGAEERRELVVEPRGPWRYGAPLFVMIGGGTAGPGERLALMLRQVPLATTLGEPTAGACLGPRWVEVSGDLAVWLGDGRYFDAEGSALDGVGLVPEVAIAASPEEFDEEHDPVLFRVLELVLEIPEAERRAGNRD